MDKKRGSGVTTAVIMDALAKQRKTHFTEMLERAGATPGRRVILADGFASGFAQAIRDLRTMEVIVFLKDEETPS